MFSVMTAARASVGARTEFGSSSRWIDRWLAACRDLAELERSNPMTDAVVDEIDGRMIRIGDQWLADFASCNYLGFDLDREIIDSVLPALERWGTHPSWSRLLGSPVLYEQIEERLTELVGAEDVLVLPTITLIHMSVIPVLAGDGTIYVDRRAHKRTLEGLFICRGLSCLPERAQAPAQDGGAALSLFGPLSDRIACDDARRPAGERAARRRDPRRPVGEDGDRARVPRPPRRAHAEQLRLSDHRGPARSRRGHRRGRQIPLRERHLRHPRRLSAQIGRAHV